MLPSTDQGEQQNTPYAWQGGDTSTFSQQAQNLSGTGDQGLNTDLVDVQKQTADAYNKAAQTAQNVAAGTGAVATGATVDPAVAQAATGSSSDPKVAYTTTGQAPAAPSTTITPKDVNAGVGDYSGNVDSYLNGLFPNGIPQSIQDELNKALSQGPDNSQQATQQGDQVANPAWQDAYNKALAAAEAANPSAGNNAGSAGKDAIAAAQQAADQATNGQRYVGAPGWQNNDTAAAFQDYLNNLKTTYQNQANNPEDVQQFQNYLQGQLSNQLQNLGENYTGAQNDLATQNTVAGQNISDYIAGLQKGLKTYQTNTGDLGNVGQMSNAENASAAANAILANPGDQIAALNALSSGGAGNTRLAALSQQAQNAAIQQAETKAQQNQNTEKNAENNLAGGQKAMQKANADAGTAISTNQNNLQLALDKNATAAQQQLADAYNNSKTNLNKQEQDYVSKAQDTLKNANVPEESIKDATNAFAQIVQNQIATGNLSDAQKQNLGKNLEQVFRTAVGTGNSDINFSNEIANIMIPLYKSLGYTPSSS